jgi:hypothetical protein
VNPVRLHKDPDPDLDPNKAKMTKINFSNFFQIAKSLKSENVCAIKKCESRLFFYFKNARTICSIFLAQLRDMQRNG